MGIVSLRQLLPGLIRDRGVTIHLVRRVDERELVGIPPVRVQTLRNPERIEPVVARPPDAADMLCPLVDRLRVPSGSQDEELAVVGRQAGLLGVKHISFVHRPLIRERRMPAKGSRHPEAVASHRVNAGCGQRRLAVGDDHPVADRRRGKPRRGGFVPAECREH